MPVVQTTIQRIRRKQLGEIEAAMAELQKILQELGQEIGLNWFID